MVFTLLVNHMCIYFKLKGNNIVFSPLAVSTLPKYLLSTYNEYDFAESIAHEIRAHIDSFDPVANKYLAAYKIWKQTAKIDKYLDTNSTPHQDADMYGKEGIGIGKNQSKNDDPLKGSYAEKLIKELLNPQKKDAIKK